MDIRKQILSQIKKTKYKNQRGMAKALGMSESQFSQSLRFLSENFLDRLQEKGIVVDSSIKFTATNRSTIIGGDSNSGLIFEELTRQLAKAEGRAETYRELYEKALLKIAELERKGI